MKIKGEQVTLRSVRATDILPLWEMMYGVKDPEWKKWDAPYFPFERPDYHSFERQQLQRVGMENNRLVIDSAGEPIGDVMYYWEHKPSKWLETGIAVYNPKYWNRGLGTEALALWIEHLFSTISLPRVGFTTWSGNPRIIRVGEKIGMKLEGRLRKVRYYNGKYYDSIRMGVLREEWADIRKKLFCLR
ncbi:MULTISPECIES: GNAT family N-acetyltransferase [Alteribacter]|uniref:N-acetyltransferase n=1 Tax=Alteribacter keqinensis TaxID=2483800 RepID=A0A3M7U194_9BACI|nr:MULTISPECIES: GNAT family protein [Alteribacter]MBM7096329.1 GNAT family N-acetyltransferase [Alteribacter salitolerans]RNA70445.1 N-acetyltransferase [Alteribacter keqinensis]